MAKKRRNSNKWIFVASADMTQFFIAPKVRSQQHVLVFHVTDCYSQPRPLAQALDRRHAAT